MKDKINRFNKVNDELIKELKELLGENNVTTDKNDLEPLSQDEEHDSRLHSMPEVAVFPSSTEEVAGIVKLANKYMVPVTPRCAGTGMSAAAVPVYHGIVISFKRMNKILELNEDSMYAVLQPAVYTADLQKEAEKHGLMYAGDPASSADSQIGGNIAANAGGLRAVKYGTSRNQYYQLKVVTPLGEIATLGQRTQKCSTGYPIEILLAGSEGTLGIITEVVVKLRPKPKYKMDLLAIFTDSQDALNIPYKIIKSGADVTSIEYMDNKSVNLTGDFIKADLPYSKENGQYVIITIETFSEDDLFEKVGVVTELCESNGAVEVVEHSDTVWMARRNIQEAVREESMIHTTEDFVVPLDKIETIVGILPKLESKYNLKTFTVAHIGDGNIHTHVMRYDMPQEEWDKKISDFHEELFGEVYKLGGRLTGEHGIGTLKMQAFKKFSDPISRKLMMQIKKAWDPNNILNPGTIFDLEIESI